MVERTQLTGIKVFLLYLFVETESRNIKLKSKSPSKSDSHILSNISLTVRKTSVETNYHQHKTKLRHKIIPDTFGKLNKTKFANDVDNWRRYT